MAADNDNDTLNALPRKLTEDVDTATHNCHYCNERIDVTKGEVKGCGCGRAALHLPLAGGLGPRTIYFPPPRTRTPRGPARH